VKKREAVSPQLQVDPGLVAVSVKYAASAAKTRRAQGYDLLVRRGHRGGRGTFYYEDAKQREEEGDAENKSSSFPKPISTANYQ